MKHLPHHIAVGLASASSAVALALPAIQDDAPEVDTRGLVLREEGAFEGYTLIAPLTSEILYLIDMAGEVVHQWEPANQTESGIFLDNGNLLRWGMSPDDNPRFQGPGVGGGVIEELDWGSNVIWTFLLNDEHQLMHHDIALLPNGNVLFLAWEYRTREEAVDAGRDPEKVDDAGIWPDVVYELEPTPPEGGKIVWTWRAWDHLVQDFDASKRNYGSVPDEPGKIDVNADHRGRPPMTPAEIEEQKEIESQMAALGYGGGKDDDASNEPRRNTAPDWLHTNAIDYLPEHDLIVLSVPTLSELWIIDHSTTTEEAATSTGGRWKRGGELLWRWGNPRNYGAGEDADQRLSFQHDPTFLPAADELRLLVFNNGRKRPGESYSSVDELVLPFDPERGFVRVEGKPFGPSSLAWSYSDPGTFYSSFISGAQRLPNGNTLVCSGAQGRVFEVTPAGEVVWDYRNPLTGEIDHGIPVNSLYRAVRVAADHPAVAELAGR